MKLLSVILSIIGLILTIVPSILVFIQIITWYTHANIMLIGAVLWFTTAPFWMHKKKED